MYYCFNEKMQYFICCKSFFKQVDLFQKRQAKSVYSVVRQRVYITDSKITVFQEQDQIRGMDCQQLQEQRSEVTLRRRTIEISTGWYLRPMWSQLHTSRSILYEDDRKGLSLLSGLREYVLPRLRHRKNVSYSELWRHPGRTGRCWLRERVPTALVHRRARLPVAETPSQVSDIVDEKSGAISRLFGVEEKLHGYTLLYGESVWSVQNSSQSRLRV